MTVKETLDHIMTLNTDSSMLELATARTTLNRIADLITSPELETAWGYASEHINDTVRDQQALAMSGAAVRIM